MIAFTWDQSSRIQKEFIYAEISVRFFYCPLFVRYQLSNYQLCYRWRNRYFIESAITATESPGKRWVRLQLLVRFALSKHLMFLSDELIYLL
jgi:hypothetical protein